MSKIILWKPKSSHVDHSYIDAYDDRITISCFGKKVTELHSPEELV